MFLSSQEFKPRRALSDLTNLLSPIQPSLPLRRTLSTPHAAPARPPSAPLEPLQRYGAAVLTQIGFSPKQAAPLLRTSTKSVRKWSEAFEDNGNVEDDYREGRPKKLDEDQCDEIVSHALKKPKLSTPKAVKRALNLDVSTNGFR